MQLIAVYTDQMTPDIAAERKAEYEKAGVEKIAFAWAGPVTPGERALLPRAGPDVRHRVRQHAEQRQPRALGVARLRQRLRPRSAARAPGDGEALVAGASSRFARSSERESSSRSRSQRATFVARRSAATSSRLRVTRAPVGRASELPRCERGSMSIRFTTIAAADVIDDGGALRRRRTDARPGRRRRPTSIRSRPPTTVRRCPKGSRRFSTARI